MEVITEKDPSILISKSRAKQFIISAKRTLIGCMAVITVFSVLQPNINYAIARKEADSSGYITSVLEDKSLSKEQQIAQIYKTAIMENNNIPKDIKDMLIDAFTSEVINYSGMFFTEDTIRNMYAVAKTETIKIIPEFIKDIGWWGGDYASYKNEIDVAELDDKRLLAHEQLHATLKKGLFGTGFTPALKGYGVNEGATESLLESESDYFEEREMINILGLILGYKDVFQTYTNSSLNSLKKLICQYISPRKANELISLIDLNTFQRIPRIIFI